jgi:hypothetical protein
MEMAAAAHLTLAAPDNEKFTVQSGASQIAQAQAQHRISIAGTSN